MSNQVRPQNLMVKLLFMVLMASTLAHAAPAVPPGPAGTGGGMDLTGQFTQACYKAFRVIQVLVTKDPSLKSIVNVDKMRATLFGDDAENIPPLKVFVVDALLNLPLIGKPVQEPNLEAFAIPGTGKNSAGVIQLLKTAPWASYVKDPTRLYLVAHEILRASGYNDDGYKISLGKLKLGEISAYRPTFGSMREGVYWTPSEAAGIYSSSTSDPICAQVVISNTDGKIYFTRTRDFQTTEFSFQDLGSSATIKHKLSDVDCVETEKESDTLHFCQLELASESSFVIKCYRKDIFARSKDGSCHVEPWRKTEQKAYSRLEQTSAYCTIPRR